MELENEIRSVVAKNFQESLKQLDRYQGLALTSATSLLFLTWKWPWVSNTILSAPIPLPPVGFPIEVSISFAALLIGVFYLGTSTMSAFFTHRVIEIAKRMYKYYPEWLRANLTFPSMAVDSSRFLRLVGASANILLIYLTVLREATWWEGMEFSRAVGISLLLTIIVSIPQIFVLDRLWNPLIPAD